MKTTQLVPNYQEVKQGQSWIGGPTNHLQRQAVPGYCGHIHGLYAENQHGKTYAKITAECINKRNDVGADYSGDLRYKTVYNQEFNKPNLRNAPLQNVADKILNERKQEQELLYQIQQENYEKAPKSINDIPPIDRLPVVGYQGYRPVYRPPLKKVVPPAKPEKTQSEFDKLAPSLQKNLLESNPILQRQLDSKIPPVVGYTGFQKGTRAENEFGKTYRQLSVLSQQK
ncbi:hypothetical protein PPERSA_00767 [Pseudocohnilembus persalinus]|uniref:Uncharacterized protein n=1 Tax=Pseudocohnilembus persalinus TaxID=266149 RepID=A0A0V0Q9N4_PSEPJ|nr:hypothetical protein PPERSA_00767 [Pseudocohnilembus persalinus]|eukprot:KRW98940.1 hypothetical protein PPERSA_00767 [Pseudocohnilembus persalinus]